jgi:hypothetical protein
MFFVVCRNRGILAINAFFHQRPKLTCLKPNNDIKNGYVSHSIQIMTCINLIKSKEMMKNKRKVKTN